MEIAVVKEKTVQFIKKYKYVVLILAIGLVLMLIPENKTQTITEKQFTAETQNTVISLDIQLSNILSQISGVGKTDVLLTIGSGETVLYQIDENLSNSEGTNSIQKDTVTITDGNHNQNGLIQQIIPPTYQGAIIVCQGADSPTVRLSVIDAVSKVTGLGTDRITVLKMK